MTLENHKGKTRISAAGRKQAVSLQPGQPLTVVQNNSPNRVSKEKRFSQLRTVRDSLSPAPQFDKTDSSGKQSHRPLSRSSRRASLPPSSGARRPAKSHHRATSVPSTHIRTINENLTLQEVTSEAYKVIPFHEFLMEIEDEKDVKPEKDVKLEKDVKQEIDVKQETVSKQEVDIIDIMDIDPAPRTSDLIANATGATKSVFYIRHRLQQIYAAATKANGATLADASEVKRHLNCLAYFHWEDGIFEKTKIAKAVKLMNKPNIFGDEIPRCATQLLDRWGSSRFSPAPLDDGVDEMEDEDVDEEGYNTSDSEEPAPEPAPTGSLRNQIEVKFKEITRGIIIHVGRRKDYKLDPRYPKRSADRFGHNGLTVGDWWPFQSFSLRDGAHGAKMGGIYGKISTGAFSVVVSGGIYDGNDQDNGERILYSGSKGDQDDAADVPPLTNATKTLILSTKHRQPVRVLRSSKTNSRWAPAHGIRYDGLYDVDSYTIKTDTDNKRFYQFVLVRQPGQPPIDRSRPTRVEIAVIHKIRSM